jgi:hypothetical protein
LTETAAIFRGGEPHVAQHVKQRLVGIVGLRKPREAVHAKIISRHGPPPYAAFACRLFGKGTANLPRRERASRRNIDVTRELGLTKKKIDVKQHADMSLVQEAAQRLK